MCCRWRKICATQIEHHLLPRPLHDVGLDELKREREDENPDVKPANLRDARQRSVAQPVANPGMRVRRLRQVFIDGDLGEERPQHVQSRLQDDRPERHRHVPLVRTQIRKQPPHQPAVVRFA
jgi:hypothetical protein